MSKKKRNSSIYHFENYMQMQKPNCILKIFLNNDELTPWAEKIKSLHSTIWSKQNGRLEFARSLKYMFSAPINVQNTLKLF